MGESRDLELEMNSLVGKLIRNFNPDLLWKPGSLFGNPDSGKKFIYKSGIPEIYIWKKKIRICSGVNSWLVGWWCIANYQ